MFENPRRGRQARNFTKNVPKILDLKSSSEQIFSKNWRWVPLLLVNNWRGRGVWFLSKSRIYTSLISIIKTKNIATVNSLLSDRKKISGLIFHDNKKKEIHFLLQDKIFIIPNIRWYFRFRNWKKKTDWYTRTVIAKIQSKPIDNNI